MRNALRSCRLYSWMRLTWLSKMVSGSSVCPELDRSHSAKVDLAARLAARTASRNPLSSAVDLEDDLQVARQQHLEPRERPFFERLGQQRVVRVRQRPLGEVPRLIPSEVSLVEQDPHQLGDGDCRVSIVELDGDLFGKRAPVNIGAPESSDQIGQRAGEQEVLLSG